LFGGGLKPPKPMSGYVPVRRMERGSTEQQLQTQTYLIKLLAKD